MSCTQLFPARYIYPDARLGGLANLPAPIFADILPAIGGFAYPTVDCEPDPWRVLSRFGNGDRYYGYPFRMAADSKQDFILQDHVNGAMLLPSGRRVVARHSESRVLATLDPDLKRELEMDREAFEDATCLLRGAVTHDGLPFELPPPLQPLVYAIVLTHWRLEMDRPGDLNSYAVFTKHAAIRGFNFYQRIQPYYSNFMRLIQNISADPGFRTYPLSNHLTDAWLGGNLRLADHLSQNEFDLGPELMRAFYRQQLDWMAGVVNLMNHTSFRTKNDPGGARSRTGQEIENLLGMEGLVFHQMQRMLRFDSHFFPWIKRASFWPDHNPAFAELDQQLLTEALPKL